MKLVKGELGFAVYSDEDWKKYEILLKEITTEIGVGHNTFSNGEDFLNCITVTNISKLDFAMIKDLFLINNGTESNSFGDFPDLEDEINYWNELVNAGLEGNLEEE